MDIAGQAVKNQDFKKGIFKDEKGYMCYYSRPYGEFAK